MTIDSLLFIPFTFYAFAADYGTKLQLPKIGNYNVEMFKKALWHVQI